MAGVKKGSISRRDFIKGTGLAVGGAAISSSVLAVACGKPAVVTPAAEPTPTPGVASFICPYDNQSFGTLAALKTHLDSAHVGATVQVSDLTKLDVNGTEISLYVKDNWTIAEVLRDRMGLTGLKISCNEGCCGMCTILVDGHSEMACMLLAKDAVGKKIITIEGLSVSGKDGGLDPVQKGWLKESGFMCGFCTPGFIMGAKALLLKNPNPTKAEVKQGLSGNICICGAYENMANSVLAGVEIAKAGG